MTSTPPTPVHSDPEHRGQLVVKDRVVAKIATTAALSVPGVVRQAGGRLPLTRRELPRADVTVGATAVAINLYVCVQWPCRLDLLDHRIRTTVGERVEFMTGKSVHSLHVVVADSTSAPGSAFVDDTGFDADPTTPSSPVLEPHEPRGTPLAAPVATLVAVGMIALSVIAGRELLAESDRYSGAPWIRNTVEWVGRLHWSGWLIPVCVLAVVIGLAFTLTAVLPRRHTHRGLRSAPGRSTVWVRHKELAKRIDSRLGLVADVAGAHTTVGRTRITTRVERTDVPDPESDRLETDVQQAVDEDLTLLDNAPTLRLKVTR